MFIAVPQAFRRVNVEIGYPDNVTIYVYTDWSTLASKLLAIPIIAAVIIVWPDRMLESRHMRQMLTG